MWSRAVTLRGVVPIICFVDVVILMKVEITICSLSGIEKRAIYESQSNFFQQAMNERWEWKTDGGRFADLNNI